MARLIARPLLDVAGVNDFIWTTEAQMQEGDPLDLYVQLVDLEKNLLIHNYSPPGLRYVPAAAATMTATVLNLDSARQFTRTATNPFADDRSIWRLQLLASDPLKGTISIRFSLTEGAVVRSIPGTAILLVDNQNELC